MAFSLKKMFIKSALAFASAEKKHFCSVIITAAGNSTRMGGVSKQLCRIGSKYLFEYSLEAFEQSSLVDEIIISARESELDNINNILQAKAHPKLKAVVKGGNTRAKSVQNAFFSIDKKSDFVAIHDGARPMISTAEIDRVFRDAFSYGCATAAHKLPDTLKRSSDGKFIEEHVDREGVYAIGTPQIFMADIYRVALANAKKKGIEATDDTSLAIAAGFKVKLTETGGGNLKVTSPDDLALAEKLLFDSTKA